MATTRRIPPARLLCTEPLEGRWLLSAPAAAVAESDAEAADRHVATLELPEEEDDDEADGAGDDLSVDDDETDGDGENLSNDGGENGGIPIVPSVIADRVESDPSEADANSQVPDGTPDVTLRRGGSVEVVEFDPADEVDNDVAVDPAELPERVLAALSARFPGADVVAADFSNDDGKAEFDVRARFDGESIEATLTPRGRVTEIKRDVDASQLPREVLDWVRQNFPGAAIGEAAVVNDARSYEVRITPIGGPGWDAKLAVHDARAPSAVFADAAAIKTDAPRGTAAAADPEAPLEDPPQQSQSGPATQQIAATPESPVETAERQSSETTSAAAGGAARGVADAGSLSSGHAAPLAESAGALARFIRRAVTHPAVAGALADALPVDAAAAERALRDLLHQLDALAGKVLPDDASPAAAGLRLVAVAALVAGVHLVVAHVRTPRGGPVVMFSATGTSWSWLIGTGTAEGTRQRRGGP
jgi:hypothetical protein